MGKSLGNAYNLNDLVERGYDPLVLRYFYLTGHYRKQLNFTWEALSAAAKALDKLRRIYWSAAQEKERTVLSEEKLEKVDRYRVEFERAIADDLNMPEALAVVWEAAKSNIPGYDKVDLLRSFDRVLGLDLMEWEMKEEVGGEIPEEVQKLVEERSKLRKEKKYQEADGVREKIEKMGYEVRDEGEKTVVEYRV